MKKFQRGTYFKDTQIKILILDNNAVDALNAKKEIQKKLINSVIKIIEVKKEFYCEPEEFLPDVIISEICLPDSDIEAIAKSFSKNIAIPLIVYTSIKNEDKAIKLLDNGAWDFVSKENPARLVHSIINAIELKNLNVERFLAETDVAEYEKYVNMHKRWESNVAALAFLFVLHPDGSQAFSYISPGSENLLGLMPEDIVGDPALLMSCIYPEDMPGLQKAIAESAAALKPFKYRARYYLKGELNWYDINSVPEMKANGDIVWDGMMVDITEQKHIEEDLAREHNFMIVLMDNLPDKIYFKDLESRFIKINKEYLTKFGIASESEILGKTDFDLFDFTHANEARFDEIDIMLTGVPIINKVEKETWSSGQVTWASTTKMLLKDGKGNITGTFGISRDVTEQKNAEEQLKLSEARLRYLISSTSVILFTLSRSDNQVSSTWIGDNVKDLLGYTTEEALEVNWWDNVIHPDDKEYMYSLFPSLFNSGRLNLEYRVKHKEGHYLWLSAEMVVAHNSDGSPSEIFGSWIDITERMMAQEALLNSEAQLSYSLKIAKIAYWEYDVLKDHLISNDQFYSILKTTAEIEGGYLIPFGIYTERFIHPEDAHIIRAEIKKAIETTDHNFSSQLEYRAIFPGGETGYMSVRFFITKDQSAKTIKVSGIIQNITERRQAEEALRTSEYILRKSQSAAHVGSFKMNLKTKIWESSPTLKEIVGIDENYPQNESGLILLIHPDYRELVSNAIDNISISKSPRNNIEFKIIKHNDGTERWVWSTVEIEFDKEGIPAAMIGTIQDITERRLREMEKLELDTQLKDRNKELEKMIANLKMMQGTLVQTEKMASLGQLSAGIAHEINNPLAFVCSNVNRLKEYFQDTIDLLGKWQNLKTVFSIDPDFSSRLEEIEKFSNQIDFNFILTDFDRMMISIQDGTQRIKKIVEGMRGFSHISENTFSEADINKAIEDTLTIVWNEIKYKAEIEKQYGILPSVTCNIGEIKQVIVNILVNAAQAIEAKGIIKIFTYTENEFVFVKVQDSGSGIPVDKIKRIFDPFFTTKAVGKGTGLGLWICSSIIEKHYGTITVESKPGIGTTFIIKLPVKHDAGNIKE